MLGQLSRKVEPDSSLDFPAGDGMLLVVVGQAGSFSGNPFKDVVHERIHDAHCLGRDTSVRMDLLQDFVDVDRVRLTARLSSLLLVTSCAPLLGSARRWCAFLGYFSRDYILGRHCCCRIEDKTSSSHE